MLSLRITKGSRIYHLGKILVDAKFRGSRSKRCSVWTKVGDRRVKDISILRAWKRATNVNYLISTKQIQKDTLYNIYGTCSCETLSDLVFPLLFFITTGMKNAMKTTPQISSIGCIHQKGRASLTAESTCWDTFSRYGAAIQDPSTLAKHSLATYK